MKSYYHKKEKKKRISSELNQSATDSKSGLTFILTPTYTFIERTAQILVSHLSMY